MPEDYPGPVTQSVKHINETIERLNRMYRFSNKIRENFQPLFRELGSRMLDFFYEAQLEPACIGSLLRIIRGINRNRPWAMSCKFVNLFLLLIQY